MRILWSLGFLLISGFCYSGNPKLDSLTALLSTEKNPEKKYGLLQRIYDLVDNFDQDSAYRVSLEKLKLANRIGKGEDRVFSLVDVASVCISIGKFHDAIFYGEWAVGLCDSLNFDDGRWSSYNVLGSAYQDKGKYEQAFKYHLKGLEFAKKVGSKFRMGSSYNNIGNLFKDQDNYEEALRNYYLAASLLKDSDMRNLLPGIYNNIGVVKYRLGEKDSAVYYYDKAFEGYKGKMDYNGIATYYANVAWVFLDEGKLDKVLEYDKMALKYYRLNGNRLGEIVTLNNISEDFSEMGKMDSAIWYAKKSYSLSSEFGYLLDARNSLDNLSGFYEKLGDFKSAFEWQRKSREFHDSLLRLENRKNVLEIQEKYESEGRKAEIRLLNEKNERNKLWLIFILVGSVLLLILVAVLFNRYRLKKQSHAELESRNEEIMLQKAIIEARNKDITDSITYSRRIQGAILPGDAELFSGFKDGFVLFLPKDIVSGDFYFSSAVGPWRVIAAVDCTGHGVPGALMSLVGHNILSKATGEKDISDPAEILDFLSIGLQQFFGTEKHGSNSTDGMDLSVVSYNTETGEGRFCGAINGIFHFDGSSLKEYPGTKISIGGDQNNRGISFSSNILKMKPGDRIFLYSDGYSDQFGGEKGKKLKFKNFKELVSSGCGLPIDKQKQFLEEKFSGWKNHHEQVDDVLVIGIEV